ncbi:hypothetical protein ACJX0J_024034, partial [Zea mays]
GESFWRTATSTSLGQPLGFVVQPPGFAGAVAQIRWEFSGNHPAMYSSQDMFWCTMYSVVPKRLYHQLATLVLIILTKYIPLNLRRCLLNF